MKRTTSIALAFSAALSIVTADIPPLPKPGSNITTNISTTINQTVGITTKSNPPIAIPIVIFGALGVGAFFLILWLAKKART